MVANQPNSFKGSCSSYASQHSSLHASALPQGPAVKSLSFPLPPLHSDLYCPLILNNSQFQSPERFFSVTPAVVTVAQTRLLRHRHRGPTSRLHSSRRGGKANGARSQKQHLPQPPHQVPERRMWGKTQDRGESLLYCPQSFRWVQGLLINLPVISVRTRVQRAPLDTVMVAGVFVTHCCITNYPSTQQLKTTINICYLSRFVAQEFGSNITGSSGMRTLIKLQSGFHRASPI